MSQLKSPCPHKRWQGKSAGGISELKTDDNKLTGEVPRTMYIRGDRLADSGAQGPVPVEAGVSGLVKVDGPRLVEEEESTPVEDEKAEW